MRDAIRIFIFVFIGGFQLHAQWLNFPSDSTDTVYDRKEEILYKDKRYRRYNNYVTIGGGILHSNIRDQWQKVMGVDYQFHLQRQYYQVGVMMSGYEFLSDNHVQAHVGYGLRSENNTTHFAIFVGPSFFTGVEGKPGVTDPTLYKGVGGYLNVQAVSKFVAYDVGLGAELFADLSQKQRIFGAKIIVFFSGAYQGVKRNYNPHVRIKRQVQNNKVR